MHFLKKLIESPILEDPAKQHIDIHRHFYRYSKGQFIGPALKISRSKQRLTLKGSHEYEDLILEIGASTISEDEVEIKGKLISGSDISELLETLGFDWNLKKSTGKTKNYIATILSHITKEKLLESIMAFRKTSYYLISFNINPTCKVTTKKNTPQPSQKKVEEDDVSKRIQFCTGVITNNENNLNLILDLVVPDFKSEINGKWKSIIIKNNYLITDIILPDNVDNWGLKRVLAIRKGKLFRTLTIDDELIEKQYSFVA
ncbi:MAG: hypothetical protein ACW96S_00525 [Promethearchaeota archaeon]|jgi:hypothetical protein